MRRETSRIVAFTRPFALPGYPGLQPAGRYMVEREEAQIDGVSFPAYRHVRTTLTWDDPMATVRMMLEVKPDALEAALWNDAPPDQRKAPS